MHSDLRARGVVGALIAVALLLAACSGPSKSTSLTKTTKTPSAAQVGSAVTQALGSVTSSTAGSAGSTASTTGVAGGVRSVTIAPSVPVATAPPACQLLTSSAASALIGVVRSTTAANTGATSSCTYTSGSNARAKLSVTAVADATIAHTQFIQAERAAGTTARGAFIGDEAFTYADGIVSRVGKVLLNLTGSPVPSTAALETAVATVVKQL